MAKDSLSEALFELKDRDRKSKRRRPAKKGKARSPDRGPPRAFDSFYVFSLMLLGLGFALQLVAIVVYA